MNRKTIIFSILLTIIFVLAGCTKASTNEKKVRYVSGRNVTHPTWRDFRVCETYVRKRRSQIGNKKL